MMSAGDFPPQPPGPPGRRAHPPVPAIWPFLDLPHMQGPQDLMGELPDREGVRSASRGRDGG